MTKNIRTTAFIISALLACLILNECHGFVIVSPLAQGQQHGAVVGVSNKNQPLKFFASTESTDTETTTGSSISSTLQEAPPTTALTTRTFDWKWRGFDIYSEVTVPNNNKDDDSNDDEKKPNIVLVHGFGCSATYWRRTKEALANAGYQVYALDLLGQGRSEKPGKEDGIEYSINLWAQLVHDFVQQHCIPQTSDDDDNENPGVILAGNSIGSLISLSTVTANYLNDNDNQNHYEIDYTKDVIDENRYSSIYKGICMFNCGVGLNSRGIVNLDIWNPMQRTLINTLYNVLVFFIFGNIPLLTYVLQKVVTPQILQETLQNIYKTSPQNVDDELVQSFYQPALDPQAPQALSQIYVNPPGMSPMNIHDRHANYLYSSSTTKGMPICLVWGRDDLVTPLNDGVGEFYQQLAVQQPQTVSMNIIDGGHVLFDDNPTGAHAPFLKWLDEQQKGK